MRYSVDRDENVVAALDLKLDPLPRARNSANPRQSWWCTMAAASIHLRSGAATKARKSTMPDREKRSLGQRIADIEARLKSVAGDARAALIQQLDALKAEAARQDATVSDSLSALATTPMHFDYYGRGGEPGFHGNPLREAWRTFVETIVVLTGCYCAAWRCSCRSRCWRYPYIALAHAAGSSRPSVVKGQTESDDQ